MAKILVIDDEGNIRMMIRLALLKEGHTVEFASDGPEGLEKFAFGDDWDLVILDQRMPGMQGLEVLQNIRRRDPEARVVMITAFGTVDLAVDAMKAGATDFLRKPFTADMLRGAVSIALRPDHTTPSGGPLPPNTVTYGVTTLNGFRIEFYPGTGEKIHGDIRHTFTVRSPDDETRKCTVLLPAYVIELVKAHADREELPGGDRFWQGFCEESLANYLWQNASFPDSEIRIDDLTTGQRRWIDAVLSVGV
jgi:CheY-like chemotaxis protein